jgi:hypothetical protein
MLRRQFSIRLDKQLACGIRTLKHGTTRQRIESVRRHHTQAFNALPGDLGRTKRLKPEHRPNY